MALRYGAPLFGRPFFQNPQTMKKRQKTAGRSWAAVRREVLAQISERQLQLLRLVAGPDQPSYKMVADAMHVKLATLHAHRRKLFSRWDITSKVGLVLFAFRWGVAEPK